jgi:hypothetical protein
MVLSFARFDLEYRRKAYRVDFHPKPGQPGQYSVTVFDGHNKQLGAWSCGGRQVVSQWNAGQMVKKTLDELAESRLESNDLLQ